MHDPYVYFIKNTAGILIHAHTTGDRGEMVEQLDALTATQAQDVIGVILSRIIPVPMED